jgi:serpin B
MKRMVSLLIACLVIHAAAGAAKIKPAEAADQAAVVEGNNAFAVDLYAHLRSQPGNLFFSPESISTALSMAYAGARGDTASEMAKVLHFTLPQDRLHPAMGAILSGMNAPHQQYQLHVANALWAEKDYAVLGDFLKLTVKDYDAGFNRVDFKGAPEAARLTINQWVEQKTNNKINELLQPGTVNSSTKLVLTDAIYFMGNWEKPFGKDETAEEDFRVSPAQSVKAPLMHQEYSFNYFNGGTFQVLDIPYKYHDLSMIVFLPDDVAGLPAFEQSLTSTSLQLWHSKLVRTPVILTLPRFKVTRQFGLADTLGAMGMRGAFDANAADFSGITGNRDLSISAVIHKAFVDMNEQGTEAAAATAVTFEDMAARGEEPPPPIVFRVDHPFVFLIRDNRSGAILFMGRVTDPTM